LTDNIAFTAFSGFWFLSVQQFFGRDPVQEHYGMTEEEFVGGDSTGCQYYSLHVILTMVLVRIPVHREKGTPFFTKEREQEREEERKREKKRLKTREKSRLLVSEANSRQWIFSVFSLEKLDAEIRRDVPVSRRLPRGRSNLGMTAFDFFLFFGLQLGTNNM